MVSKSPSTKKPLKKSSSQNIKYASKYLGSVMANVIADKIKTLKKNSKTTEKWCQKMQLSLQRKVSEASLTLFASEEQDIKSLELKINALNEKIKAKEELIKSAAVAAIKSNPFHDIPTISEAGSYVPKQFEAQTNRISHLFSRLATKIDEIRKEVPTQANKLKSVVQVVDNSWQQQLQQSMIEGDGRIPSVSSSFNTNIYPSGRLQSHLSSYH